MAGRDFLKTAGYTFAEYVTARKQNIKDVHFQVFFGDKTLSNAFYPGYVMGRDLVVTGTVGPPPPTLWVLYHKLPIRLGKKAGTERSLFP